MYRFKSKNVCRTIRIILYIALTLLGIFFINKGDVFPRFLQKRTNFAEYGEQITEMPTIVTWIQYSNLARRLEFGKDYQINYSEHPWATSTNLTQGENWISSIKIRFDVKYDSYGQQMLQTTPLDFNPGILENAFRLTYLFENQTESQVTRVGISLSARNNSHCAWGWNPYDGDIARLFVQPGELKKVVINPEKYVFSSDSEEPCRTEPYNDVLVKRMYENQSNVCSKPCRQYNYWICNSDLEGLFDYCHTDEGFACFWDSLHGLTDSNGKAKDILLKPCTKLQYKYEESIYAGHEIWKLEFEFSFTLPPKVSVKEEYLIYDMVSMISAIGGTMGLCVGFSFRECIDILLDYLERSYKSVFCPKSTRVRRLNDIEQGDNEEK